MRSFFNILSFIWNHPLARKSRWRALRRFFGFQLSQLIFKAPIVYKLTERSSLIIEKGMTGATGNLYCGLHEFEDMAFVMHFLRSEDIFVDVGANVGTFTILASGHVGAQSMAFEPIPITYNRLQNNIAINHLEGKVIAHQEGIGADIQKLSFTIGLDTVNHVASNADDQCDLIDVQVRTLDSLEFEKDPILIKIDVEGYETEVLKGANQTLSSMSLQAIIIESNTSGNRYGFTDDQIHHELVKYGFSAYSYDPYLRKLEMMNQHGILNTIYLRDKHFAEKRIMQADKFKIHDQLI